MKRRSVCGGRLRAKPFCCKRRIAVRRTTAALVCAAFVLCMMAGTKTLCEASANTGTTENADEEAAETDERLLREAQDGIDYDRMEEATQALLDSDTLTFREMVDGLIRGEYGFDMQTLWKVIKEGVFGRLSSMRSTLIQLVVLALLSAVFTVFSSAFGSAQVSDVGFYIALLLLTALLLHTFAAASEIVTDTIERVLAYVKVMMPAYVVIVAAAGGQTTAVLFYEFFLLLVFAVNWLIVRLLIPLVHMYVIMGIVNHISKEDLFSGFAGLIRRAVQWCLKALLTTVVGFQLIQGLVTPYVDSLKATALHGTLSSLPGIGNLMNSVTETAIGAGILIKNGIGTAMLVMIVLACAVPVLTVGAYTLLFQLAGALIQPVADKRIVRCLSYVSDGCALLLRTLLVTCLLFLLSIAVLTATTNGGIHI